MVCVRRAEVQNSMAVFQLSFSNDINFSASIFHPNAKPPNRCMPYSDEPKHLKRNEKKFDTYLFFSY